jgi:hypothetical protein
VYRFRGYRFFFFSREGNEPRHIHVRQGDNYAKYWLEPVALAESRGFIVDLVDGRRVSAPLEWFPRLLNATPAQRANWNLIGRGVGIHWEDVDEDVSVKSLLAV